ncbi:MDR family MFS transporter [Protaetiibacter intestinalis]|uniref:DHA2 family efflux MFS transporter permease subunit n=1 Tax=Protaetiibacter intestinalis TaxID=2419774 RepID=A0A387BC14_9MICO|nr:MDR family MFS transporter [Protaetiibacter intestinalis]AYF99248.1 DHA2 family efflux MFS transporter permease subunit [Protaetiibacter intestinalis]
MANTLNIKPSPSTDPPRRAGLALGLLLVSAFVVVLNETAMGVAIPPIMADFGVTASAAQWLTTAFMLTMAVVIPVTGLLLQRYTLRRNFFTAMGLFALGTTLAAIAPIFELLLVARIVQATGTAIMLPLLFTTVMNLVEPDKRGRSMGLVAVVTAVAPAIGPTVSGVILSGLGWRWIFLIVLPIALIAIAAGARWLRNVTPTSHARFDILSVALSALGFAGLIYGLVSIGEPRGAKGSFGIWLPLAVGVAALAALIVRQLALRHTDRMLLDVRVFAHRAFTLSTVAIVVVSMALFGSLILLPLYIQQVLGEPAHVAGLMLLPGGILSGLLAPFVGALYDKVGPRVLILPGSIVVALAMFALSTLGGETPVGLVIAMHLFLSVGTSLMVTPLMTTALGSVTPVQYPHGSAIVNTLQQVSGAAGIALFVTLFSLGATSGTGTPAASAGGVQLAFLIGALISCAAIPVAVFLRRPTQPESAESS